MPMLLHVMALGCPKNRVDVEAIVGLARAGGLDLTADPRSADVILVSTCGFITPASQESIDTVLELARIRRPGTRLVVAGCLSQRYGEDLARLVPEADFLVGTADLDRVVDAILGRGERLAVGRPGGDLRRPVARSPSQTPGSAYLKVADGCSRRCAFCTIPSIRGPYRSRSIADICDEARDLARLGVVEVNLVAQDVTAFGRDRSAGEDLAGLLRALSGVDGLRWIRPLYLYPERSLEPVLRAMATLTQVVPYLDLPIQHAADPVLRRMKRGHRRALLRSVIQNARQTIPGLSLRTTVIVGHPGEGPHEFADLLDFIVEQRFEHLGAFRFSPEDGTASAAQRGAPAGRDSYHRYRKVMAVQRKISRRLCRARRGQVLEVLVEGPSDESPLLYTARHAGQAPEVDGIVFLDRPVEPGRMVHVKVIDSGDYDLVGEVLDGAESYQM